MQKHQASSHTWVMPRVNACRLGDHNVSNWLDYGTQLLRCSIKSSVSGSIVKSSSSLSLPSSSLSVCLPVCLLNVIPYRKFAFQLPPPPRRYLLSSRSFLCLQVFALDFGSLQCSHFIIILFFSFSLTSLLAALSLPSKRIVSPF